MINLSQNIWISTKDDLSLSHDKEVSISNKI